MTAQPKLVNSIPCKYIIVKYVEDKVRDEPVNVGVILQNQESYKVISKFVNYSSILRSGNLNKSQRIILEALIGKVKDTIGKVDKNEETLSSIIENHSELRFTEIRGTLANNPFQELDNLFTEYLNIGIQLVRITTNKIIQEVLNHLYRELYGYKIQRQYYVKGKTSNFKFDLVIEGKTPKFVEAISFDEKEALEKTKIFDWSVKDTMGENKELTYDNFVAILSEPSPKSTAYESVIGRYNDAIKILSTNEYPIVNYDSKNNWKERLKNSIVR